MREAIEALARPGAIPVDACTAAEVAGERGGQASPLPFTLPFAASTVLGATVRNEVLPNNCSSVYIQVEMKPSNCVVYLILSQKV
jgi:hypothetical protein